MIDILQDLNEKQRTVVTHKTGPLLVIAGPGTGKTKVITHRISYLIHHYGINPENILAITFTNKAAHEMRERIKNEILGTHGTNVKISTFHSFCNRTLRKYANKIDLDEDFTVLEQQDQDKLLTEIVNKLNFKLSDYKPKRMLNIINNLKGDLQELTETSEYYENGLGIIDEDDVTKIRHILNSYQSELDGRNSLDFDDLLLKTVILLEKNPDVNETYHKEISHILVDEFHDVNKAQYRLLQLLCEPSEQNLMIVADKDQAIYSWRGASTKYIDRFQTEFTPNTVGLEKHYRCTKTILTAAKEVIAQNSDLNRPSLRTDNCIGEKIVHCTFSERKETEEAQRIIELISNIKQKHMNGSDNEGQPNSIAILYRNHKFADVLVEQLALKNDIQFRQWIQSTNYFQEKFRQAIVSYLSELEPKTFFDIEHAINFPEMCIDELTLVQLRKLAKQKGIGLARFLREENEFLQDFGPLTRENICKFRETIDKFESEVKIENEKISRIVLKLLNVLEYSRSPYRSEELKIIENHPDVPHIAEAQDLLHRAVDSGERIHITASYGIDEYCTARIFRQTFETYLNHTVQVQLLLLDDRKPRLVEKGLHILIGDFDELKKENADMHVILIGTIDKQNFDVIQLEHSVDPKQVTKIYTVRSVTALKLCQHLVGSFEVRNFEDIVIYDLETTGVDPKIANIVQIAAWRLDAGGNKFKEYGDDQYRGKLVKPPDGYIPKESTQVHKISEKDVKDKPGINTVLPEFCEFIQDNILVGHNIAQYDNRILERDMQEYLHTEFTNLYCDTLLLARRLFPQERRSLGALARKFKIDYKDAHQAERDVEINLEIFKKLISADSKKREVKSLTEFLPFVGFGILDKTEALWQDFVPTKRRNGLNEEKTSTEVKAFLNAATRSVKNYCSLNDTADLLQQVDSLLLEPAEKAQIRAFIGKLRQAKIPDSSEDIEWKEGRANMRKSVRRFEEISNDHRLSSFLNYQIRIINAVHHFEKISNAEDSTREKNKRDEVQEQLTLMSLHTAKGTEFDVVIIVGMEEGSFPWMWRWTPERIEEERRLFYVGMTRAKKRLYLCTSMYRFYENRDNEFLNFSEGTPSPNDQNQAVSMFVREIPSDYVIKWSPRHSM